MDTVKSIKPIITYYDLTLIASIDVATSSDLIIDMTISTAPTTLWVSETLQ